MEWNPTRRLHIGLQGTVTTRASQLLYAYELSPQTVVFAGYSDKFLDDDYSKLTRTDRTFF